MNNAELHSPWLLALRAFATEASATIKPGCVLGLLAQAKVLEAKTFNHPPRAFEILSHRPDRLTEEAIVFINRRRGAKARN